MKTGRQPLEENDIPPRHKISETPSTKEPVMISLLLKCLTTMKMNNITKRWPNLLNSLLVNQVWAVQKLCCDCVTPKKVLLSVKQKWQYRTTKHFAFIVHVHTTRRNRKSAGYHLSPNEKQENWWMFLAKSIWINFGISKESILLQIKLRIFSSWPKRKNRRTMRTASRWKAGHQHALHVKTNAPDIRVYFHATDDHPLSKPWKHHPW